MVSEQEKSAEGARKDALQKKKALFRERIRNRRAQLAREGGRSDDDSDRSDGDENEADDREEVVAAVEAEMLGVLGGANISSQREAWPEVIEGTRLGQGSSHTHSPTALTPLLPLYR